MHYHHKNPSRRSQEGTCHSSIPAHGSSASLAAAAGVANSTVAVAAAAAASGYVRLRDDLPASAVPARALGYNLPGSSTDLS